MLVYAFRREHCLDDFLCCLLAVVDRVTILARVEELCRIQVCLGKAECVGYDAFSAHTARPQSTWLRTRECSELSAPRRSLAMSKRPRPRAHRCPYTDATARGDHSMPENHLEPPRGSPSRSRDSHRHARDYQTAEFATAATREERDRSTAALEPDRSRARRERLHEASRLGRSGLHLRRASSSILAPDHACDGIQLRAPQDSNL